MTQGFFLPHILNIVINYAALAIEYIGFIIIIFSVSVALVKVIATSATAEDVRKELARKIVFGLEFVIAADIILASVTLELIEIAQLGGIVVIRVLLGYSLRKEIGMK